LSVVKYNITAHRQFLPVSWSLHAEIIIHDREPILRKPSAALFTPSWKAIALAILRASSYFRLASAMSPSISANSPILCVATAQPMSHSVSRSGGLILAAIANDFSAQERALLTRAGREMGGVPGVGGGICWAREIERLFTARGS